MKNRFLATTILGACGSFLLSVPAFANNPSVEAGLANYADVSLFYQALLNTGVINELDPNTKYTIFAPTNQAFAQIQPNQYPCFYSVQCRSQVADVLRDHIVVGQESLRDLVHEADVSTMGPYRVHVDSPYIGEYTVGNRHVLSAAEFRGNTIYRIDGVIVDSQQLAQFSPVPPNDTVAETVTTYQTPVAYPVPGGNYPLNAVQMVTQKTYVIPAAKPPTVTTIYPDGTETTTVTRTMTTQP